MSKNKHHYVPRLYLKNFASEPKRINIFHIEKQLAIRSGSLRDQCYKHKLYGRTDELEDILSEMEGKIAPVIRSILNASKSFRLNAEDHRWLMIFLGLQITRTTAAAEKFNEGVDKLMKLIFSKQAEQEGIDLSEIRIGYENPVLHSMQHFVTVAASLSDLIPHLLINQTVQTFITSDNPVVLYNQYREGIKGVGTTGAAVRGLQLFLPLSPNHFLLLYDSKIYKLNDRESRITVLTNADDVKMLNLLSAANAEEVILFSDWQAAAEVRRLAQKSNQYRQGKAIAEEYVSEDDPYKSLIHFSYDSLDVGLRLSFMKLRRQAQRVPLIERMHEFRDRPTPPQKGETGKVVYRRSSD